MLLERPQWGLAKKADFLNELRGDDVEIGKNT